MISLDEVDEFFYLSELSPSGLRWKVDKVGGCGFRRINTHAHSDCGGISNGYWVVKHNYKTYYCHKILYMLRNRVQLDDPDVVDHIDGNKLNNSKENLRKVTPTVNSRNKAIRVTSKSGITGVSVYPDSRGNKMVVASWNGLDKKQKWKRYSVNKYGIDAAIAMASSYRDEQIAELNRLGAGYTDRHTGK